MPERQKRILEMLASNKINADEAHRLLAALEPEQSTPEDASQAETAAKARAKYLRVSVRPGLGHEHDAHAERVDVRVPMALIRSGIRLTSLMPEISSDIVIHRLVGDIRDDLLVAPRWKLAKTRVLQLFEERLEKEGLFQGNRVKETAGPDSAQQ